MSAPIDWSNYFDYQNQGKSHGEEKNYKCGKCDVCIERNKIELSDLEFEKIKRKIEELLLDQTMSNSEIASNIRDIREEKILKVMQWLTDNDKVLLKENKYSWVT